MIKKKSQNLSIIDKDLTVEGSIASQGRLVIKGTVKGAIVGEDVIIAEEGMVFSNIKVVNLTIGGVFKGEISASEELVILSTGDCSGKVVCKNLVVEGGGKLNAEVFSSVGDEIKLVQNFTNPSLSEPALKEKKRGHIVEI
ncbi:MAG: polymer-forming cytoskeletal protein [Proteobacteria bacterium]|nr:polymer-forming cytoskeletal protein [Pseudomonadota bacterium]